MPLHFEPLVADELEVDRVPVADDDDEEEVDVLVVRIVDEVGVAVVRAKGKDVVLGTLLEPVELVVVDDLGDFTVEAWLPVELPVDCEFDNIDDVEDLLVDAGFVADGAFVKNAKVLLALLVAAGTNAGVVLLGVLGIVNAILPPAAESPPLLFVPRPTSTAFFALLSPNENPLGAGVELDVLATNDGRRVASTWDDEVLAGVFVTVPLLALLLPLPLPTLLLLDADRDSADWLLCWALSVTPSNTCPPTMKSASECSGVSLDTICSLTAPWPFVLFAFSTPCFSPPPPNSASAKESHPS